MGGSDETVVLQRLRYFVALADELSFSRAAAVVGVTQQALSHQIGCLEREVGRSLFFRTTRRVDLTPAGRALLPGARACLDSANEAFQCARAADPDPRYNRRL
jgi:DNA-binding transcriptional LysR family regulator